MELDNQIKRIREFMGINEDPKDKPEKKVSGEKWIKCVNCKKRFTQTIHKGKKSLPICPWCGTHNEDKDKKSDSKD